MAPLNIAVIFVSLLVVSTRSFVITNEDPILPTQEIFDDNSFIRILPNQGVKMIVKCPPGTSLDKTSLICRFNNIGSSTQATDSDDCPLENSDAHPNPDSCRSFILCGAAGSFVLDCPSNLLFNVEKNYCDWPRSADCCEFLEKNSSRLVQNSM